MYNRKLYIVLISVLIVSLIILSGCIIRISLLQSSNTYLAKKEQMLSDTVSEKKQLLQEKSESTISTEAEDFFDYDSQENTTEGSSNVAKDEAPFIPLEGHEDDDELNSVYSNGKYNKDSNDVSNIIDELDKELDNESKENSEEDIEDDSSEGTTSLEEDSSEITYGKSSQSTVTKEK